MFFSEIIRRKQTRHDEMKGFAVSLELVKFSFYSAYSVRGGGSASPGRGRGQGRIFGLEADASDD